MNALEKTVEKVKTAVETEQCPECKAHLNFSFTARDGWALTCPACHWSCGGN